MKYDAQEFRNCARRWINESKPEEQLINEEYMALRLLTAVDEAERLRAALAKHGIESCGCLTDEEFVRQNNDQAELTLLRRENAELRAENDAHRAELIEETMRGERKTVSLEDFSRIIDEASL